MKIKIKVKNIILLAFIGLFIYLVLIPLSTLEIARYLDKKGSEKSKIFYESFISKSVIWNKSEALYEYGNCLVGFDGKFQLTMMGWGGGGSSTLEDMNKAINSYKKILEKEKKSKKDIEYTVLAYEGIMNAYINLQSPEDLIYWIEWGKRSDNKEINYMSDLYLSFYHFANRDYHLAQELLDKYDESSKYIDYRYYYMKGELALWRGDIELAKKLFKGEGDGQYLRWNHKVPAFGSYSFGYRDFWIENYYEKIKGDLKLKGRVSFNGKPMPFVEVYLQKIGGGFRTGGGYLVGITDINGEYETIGFEPNRYEIGIGLNQALLYDKVYQKINKSYIDLDEEIEFDFSFVSPFKIINLEPNKVLNDDKFTLEWEEVDGAEYYQVDVTAFNNPLNKSEGNISFPIEDENYNIKLKGNKAVFDMEILRQRSGGLFWSGDDMIVDRGGILSVFIPGNDYPLVVEAYDLNGNLINSSATQRTYYEDFPSITVQGELNEGEKLIYNMKYEEAIEYYTRILEVESNNKEALLYLSKIYMVGYKKDKSDYDKAMEYAIKYDNLNGDNSLKYEVIGSMDHKSKRKHKELIGQVFEDISKEYKGDRAENFYYDLGKYYLSLGEYKLARESFKKITSYRHIYIMYIDLYYGEIDKVLELIPSLHMYNMDKKQMEKALRGIDNTKTEDYKTIQNIIEKILSEDIGEEEGKDISDDAKLKIKDPYVKILLDQIIQENNWNRDNNES